MEISNTPLEVYLGKVIREGRKERKITQVALAKSCRTTQSMISMTETGRRGGYLNLSLLQRIAGALDIRPGELIRRAEKLQGEEA